MDSSHTCCTSKLLNSEAHFVSSLYHYRRFLLLDYLILLHVDYLILLSTVLFYREANRRTDREGCCQWGKGTMGNGRSSWCSSSWCRSSSSEVLAVHPCPPESPAPIADTSVFAYLFSDEFRWCFRITVIPSSLRHRNLLVIWRGLFVSS